MVENIPEVNMNLAHGRNSQKQLHLPDLSATMLGNLLNKSTSYCNIENYQSYPVVSDLQNSVMTGYKAKLMPI